MPAPPVWTITDRPNPNFCTPSHFSGFSGTICGHMRTSRLMSCVHDRRRLTDWELLVIGHICWGSGLAPIQPLSGLFLAPEPQLNLIYVGSIASDTVPDLVWHCRFFTSLASIQSVAWNFSLSLSKSEVQRKEKVCKSCRNWPISRKPFSGPLGMGPRW